MEGGWSQGEKVKTLCGKGQETKVALSLWERMGGGEGNTFISQIKLCPRPQARS